MPSPPLILDGVMPKNATLWERVLGQNVDRLLDLDADRIRHLWDPWTCDIDDLPYLAWALSVDIWDPDWPDAKKRAVTANALRDHRLKGTLGGIETYLGYRDTIIRKAVQPPAKPFAVQGIKPGEREAWIAHLPQIRIYPYLTMREAPAHRGFLNGAGGHRSFLGHAGSRSFVQASKGPNLYGRRATFQQPGSEEVDAIVDETPVYGQAPSEIVRIGFGRSKRAFIGRASMGSGFMQTSRASQRVVNVRLSSDAGPQFLASSGLQLQDVAPTRINQIREAPKRRAFMGRDYFGERTARMLTSAAPRLIYDRFALLTPGVDAPIHHGHSFMGFARFGIAPFTAELRIELPMKRPTWRAGVGRRGFMSGFLKKADMTALTNAREAIGQARGLTDTVLIDPENYRVVRLGDKPKLGSFKLGEIKPRRT
jgi:hypothetical protein